MQKIPSFFLVIVLLLTTRDVAISLVYNLKLRRIFSIDQSFEKSEKKSKTVVSALPLFYTRSRHIVGPSPLDTSSLINVSEKRRVEGGLCNARYITSNLSWTEITASIQHESSITRGTSNLRSSRTGFDDIVLTIGHNIAPNRKAQIALYALSGFPSRRKVTNADTFDSLIGTRFFSIGSGVEFSYALLESKRQTCMLLLQNRFIHFFKREFFPVLPSDAKNVPGNVTDVLCSLLYRYKKTIFEGGYNGTFFTNASIKLPKQSIPLPSEARNSLYLTCSQIIKKNPLFNSPLIIGFGVDRSWANLFSTKIGIYWISLNALF